MKKNPIIKRYVNIGWRALAGNFKFSEALNFLCRVGLALRGVANRVKGVFCFVFLSCGAWILKKSSLRLDKKYFTPFKAGRGEAELKTKHNKVFTFTNRYGNEVDVYAGKPSWDDVYLTNKSIELNRQSPFLQNY